MKCYYEELGVDRNVDDAEIKTAYRKLALRWHPDKNPDRLEEAKERFQLVQQAYEVLSDPQERSWYDKHREQILRGKNSDYEDNCLDLFQFFTVSCFKGYGDDPKGFYSVYKEVFERIAAEDAEFMSDEEEIAHIPHFGNSQSSYETIVGPFYAYWMSYCTKKPYTWLCPYNIQEIRDRRIIREIEKDLKKVAQKVKKERNEEVRNLVAFVKKRDKRVQAYKLELEQRALLNRQKQEQNRIDQIRKRQQEIHEMQQASTQTFNEDYERQLQELEQQYGTDSEEEVDDYEVEGEEIGSDDVDDNNFHCIACNKQFLTEKEFTNHENSKKHRANVELLKTEILRDDESYKDQEKEEANTEGEENEDEFFKEYSANGTVLQQKKNKKLKKPKSALRLPSSPTNKGEEEYDCLNVNKVLETSDSEDWASGKRYVKKSKARRAPKKVAQATAPLSPSDGITKANDDAQSLLAALTVNGEDNAEAHTLPQECATCHAKFDSKNKLFAHLKKTNHSVYLPQEKAQKSVQLAQKNKTKRKK